MNALDIKSLRLNAQLNVPSPAEQAAIEIGLARVSMSSYYSMPTSPLTEEYAPDEEPHQDSIQVNKWTNPKASRTGRPQGKGNAKEASK